MADILRDGSRFIRGSARRISTCRVRFRARSNGSVWKPRDATSAYRKPLSPTLSRRWHLHDL
jgi:hypothetical protein